MRHSITLAHGFTQNKNCWGEFATELAKGCEVEVVDLPGHGEANISVDGCSLTEAGQDLVNKSGIYVGYSMGGRVLMHGAIQNPELVEAAVLVSAHPGLGTQAAQFDRAESDALVADKLRSAGLANFLDGWLAGDMFKDLTADQKCLEQQLQNRVEGLVQSLERRGLGQQANLASQLASLQIPILLISGDQDLKFTGIYKELAPKLAIAASTHVTVSGGHAMHLQNPTETVDAVTSWLSGII